MSQGNVRAFGNYHQRSYRFREIRKCAQGPTAGMEHNGIQTRVGC